MIPFEFDYFKPSSLQEAVHLFQRLSVEEKQPMYFSGGTEIITLGRVNRIYTNAVIDIKGIPECLAYELADNHLYTGAGLPLTVVENGNIFPLLTAISREVSDRTTRRKVTLGGNICGHIPYREAVLPFLLAESDVVIAGGEGIRCCPITEIFDERLRLEQGEFLVQLITDRKYLSAPYVSFKRRKQWDTGYPVLVVAALKIDGKLRVAVSGLSPYPFRSEDLEDIINDRFLGPDERVKAAIASIGQPVVSDTEGSAEYKLFVLSNLLLDVIAAMEVM